MSAPNRPLPSRPWPTMSAAGPFPAPPNPGYLPKVGAGPRRSRRFLYSIVAVVVAVIAVATVILWFVLVVPFSANVVSTGCKSPGTPVSLPALSSVTFSWSVVTGGSVTLTVSALGVVPVYNSSGTSGSGSFLAELSPYDFNITSCGPATVHVVGNSIVGGGFF